MSSPTASSPPLHVQLDARTLQRETLHRSHRSPTYHRTPHSYRSTHSGLHSQARTPNAHSPRASMSTTQLQHLLEKLEMGQYNTYGVEELRDGFFDASFYRPIKQPQQQQQQQDEHPHPPPRPTTITAAAAVTQWARAQLDDVKQVVRLVCTTSTGVALLKSFLAYFTTYVLCLIPATREWLGKYSYWALIAALFNHPGRTTGAQIEGTVSCVVGGALGLAVGALALEIATSTRASGEGYGGVLTVGIVLFIGVASWIRCSLVRVYQAMMSAGLAFFFLILADVGTVAREGRWSREMLRLWAVPWGVGLAICAVVNAAIIPEAGGKAVATALHKALLSALDGLDLSRSPSSSSSTHRNMSLQLVNLSEAVRDMRSEIILSSLPPSDALQLRNLLQAVIRIIMAIKPDPRLFETTGDDDGGPPAPSRQGGGENDTVIIDLSPTVTAPAATSNEDEDDDILSVPSTTTGLLSLVRAAMAAPTQELLTASTAVLHCCDTTLMTLLQHTELLRDDDAAATDLSATVDSFAAAVRRFDAADTRLLESPELPGSYAAHPDLVKLFLFVHPVRQTADAILALAEKVLDLGQGLGAGMRKRVHLPDYPLAKWLYRASPQVRHDRGGLTAGYYFKSKQRIEAAMERYHSRPFDPSPDILSKGTTTAAAAPGVPTTPPGTTAEPETWRFRTWRAVHRLQQFESRFAVKVVLVTALLCVPAWARTGRRWYVEDEGWWCVVAAWFMMHPRVGGNLWDLLTRSAAVAAGAVWGGLAAGVAGGGNHVVMAVFAAVFMLPCIFQFTASSHQRSGLMGCISFSVVSISASSSSSSTGGASAVHVAWTRGAALIVGIVSAVVVNWVIWPFVARHELRKSLAFMMLNLGISYRGVVARYIYYDADSGPTKEDLERSEMQEALLREGFVRMRELLEMTTHEIRLRGPFDCAPYSAAIDSCERLLEHITEVRQSSLFFQPFLYGGTEEYTRKMISVRRDAVASILMNLYILAGALRAKRPVPMYLPSAAAARQRLLERMAEIEGEDEEVAEVRPAGAGGSRRWADVYQYAYSSALTDIVGQLEMLQRYTKAIAGEMALDFPDW